MCNEPIFYISHFIAMNMDIWDYIEILTHLLIILLILGYSKYTFPLPDENQSHSLFFFGIAISLHLLLILLPNHQMITTTSHLPRLYQIYCFGQVFFRFSIFNLKHLMRQSWNIAITTFILLPGNFNVACMDVLGFDITGIWFIFNMTINLATCIKTNDAFKYYIICNYVCALVFVIVSYTLFHPVYVFWYVTFAIFVILRIESLKLEARHSASLPMANKS
eukprot:NODE_70_length_24940_cov_0.663138.p15 type:complete len:221 gc:universal NODE_70_length_24940_cov_0.663138:18662-18000(-)